MLSSPAKTFDFGLEYAKVEAEMHITEAYWGMTKEQNFTPSAIEQRGDVSRLIKYSQMQRDQRKNGVSLSR